MRLSDGAGPNPVAQIAFARGNPAITLGSTIYFKKAFCPDFCAPQADLNGFMHEMTHVWQFQRLGKTRFLLRYAREFARVGGHAGAMYLYKAGDRFDDAMLEAQAEMVGDYSAPPPTGPKPDKALLARNLAGSGIYGL